MHVGVRIRTGHLFWAKNRGTCDLVNFKAVLDEYWSSTKLEFTVPSQLRSPTSRSFLIVSVEVLIIGKYRWSLELRFAANTAVRLLAVARLCQLMMFA